MMIMLKYGGEVSSKNNEEKEGRKSNSLLPFSGILRWDDCMHIYMYDVDVYYGKLRV